MEIINNNLKLDLSSGRPIKLDFGCGRTKHSGCYGVDVKKVEGVDVVADFNKPLSEFPDNCCDFIYSAHTLEHIGDILGFIEEVYRVSKPGAKLEFIVPHYSNVLGYSDPTHCRLFGLYSMFYFSPPELQPETRKVPSYYADVKFKVERVTIEFYTESVFDKLVVPFLRRLININIKFQHFYERRLSSLFHAAVIRYELVAIK